MPEEQVSKTNSSCLTISRSNINVQLPQETPARCTAGLRTLLIERINANISVSNKKIGQAAVVRRRVFPQCLILVALKHKCLSDVCLAPIASLYLYSIIYLPAFRLFSHILTEILI